MDRIYSAKWQWLLAFAYALVAMYLMRTHVIPMMAPHEDGHLGGDPLYYHELAVELAGKVRAEGLGAWTLHVEGQGPAGVMALIDLVAPPGIGVVVLNATLHATACLALILILRAFFSPAVALVSALPFIVSVHQMFWFSQINKDSYVASGFMLFALGLLHMARRIAGTPTRRDVIAFVLLSGCGACLIYVGRPFIVFLLQHIAMAALVVTLAISALERGGKHLIRRASYTILCCLLLLSLTPMTRGAASDRTLTDLAASQSRGRLPQDMRNAESDGTLTDPTTRRSQGQLPQHPVANACLEKSFDGWEDARLLPPGLNAKLRALFSQRCLYFMQLYDPNPTTRYAVLDGDVYPSSPAEALSYLPRAALNGFLSPWPTTAAAHFGTSVFYTIAPLDVTLLTLTIPFFFGWLPRDRSNAAALVPVALAAGVVVIYGLGVPFIGALYRYRYPFWMLILCIGLAATLDFFFSRPRLKRRQDVV
jgi:hypothetical protein